MNLTMKLKYGCYLCIALFATFAQAESHKPRTVCDVLENIGRYDGKSVVVRGVFIWTDHGLTLSDRFDFRTCPETEHRAKEWPGAIYLNVLESEMTRIKEMLSAFQQVVENHLQGDGEESYSIVATFIGKLYTKKNLTISRDQDKSYEGSGYGQDGQYPALMLVKDVKDIRLVKNLK